MIASNRFDLLPPLVEVEPNTTKKVEREVWATRVVEQKIEQETAGAIFTPVGPPTRAFYGTFKPAEAVPLRPIGFVEVLVNPIAGPETSPILFVGPFTLEAGRDYLVGGGAAATATNIAAAISNLPGYTGSAVGTTIEVLGPAGKTGLAFTAQLRTTTIIFQFSWPSDPGFLGYVIPPIAAVEIT